MNTKISDAIKRLERACIAGMDEEFRDDVQAVLNHLAAHAVPGAKVPANVRSAISSLANIAKGDFPSLTATNVAAIDEWINSHPQPAALNEVSGNSGELGGDEREKFDTWLETISVDTTRWGDGNYTDPTAHNYWLAWQAALAATGKQQGGEVQGVNLSPIATRKLGELAAQGYVTNGVAIFNPATGHRGLVDNLGFVGWMGVKRIGLDSQGKTHE